MRAAIATRILVGVAAPAAAIVLASPATAYPSGGVPGNGVFRVGTEIAPGTYYTQGPVNPRFMCTWITRRTVGGNDIADGNYTQGPQYARVPVTVAVFETFGCQPWTPAS
jgi:hypothetical protein